jgi:hypothetical protein
VTSKSHKPCGGNKHRTNASFERLAQTLFMLVCIDVGKQLDFERQEEFQTPYVMPQVGEGTAMSQRLCGQK